MTLSADQQAAVDAIVQSERPCFLTGPGGSGKTHVIKHLQRTVPITLVCAMTGVAAQLIGAKTAHSILGIHPTYGVHPNSPANRRLENCSLLIVDEISMGSAEFLSQLIQRLNFANYTSRVLFVGDFLQLPPVSGTKIFTSPDWLENVDVLCLSQQHRQHDSAFITALNDLRIGNVSSATRELLSARFVDTLPADCVHLYSRRDAVEQGNLERLMALPAELRVFERVEEGLVAETQQEEARVAKSLQKALGNSRFPKTLQLKLGARVVLLTNTEEWVNGSTGEVIDMTDGCICVRLDLGGDVVAVDRFEEELTDDDGHLIGRTLQFPMMLAWALTVHRSQGMTLDRVGVDLRGHFETGQTYVALSRCRSLEGLHLAGDLGGVLVDHQALAYLRQQEEEVGN